MSATVASPGTAVTRARRPGYPLRITAVIGVICLLLTAASTWAAARVDQKAEDRLIHVQAKQVGAVLSTAILVIGEPLTTALSVERVASTRKNADAFTRLMAAYVAPSKLFVSASLWKRTGRTLTQIAHVGSQPVLRPGLPQTAAYLRGAFTTKSFRVRTVSASTQDRIAYAQADPGTGYVVYAERAIPANRRAPVDKNSAFSDLHYAIYFGPTANRSALSTTDVDPSSLPLRGHTATIRVPFGDTILTVAIAPRRHLGGSLGQRLPLILLIGGLLLTLVIARTSYQLVRRRQDAEGDSSTISGLYERVEALYGQQRELSVGLQKALLPHANPEISNLEIASEYVAGAQGVDVGGDWYSVIGLGEEQFGFVVGDVSGRGIDAVAVMAHARFTLRAYLLDGNSPDAALEKCSRQFDISDDGHLTTAIVGLGNSRTGEVTFASAGHPAPLLITDRGVEYVPINPGLPLGAGPSTYEPTTITLTPATTVFCFTDGLVERRSEDIDTGLARLSGIVSESHGQPVGHIVDHALRTLRGDDASDDIAVMAFTWDPTQMRARFRADLKAPASARTFVNGHLGGLLEHSDPRRADVALVVSELVTNSVRAGAETIEVRLLADNGQIEVRVTDDAAGWPTPRAAGIDDLGGRGLGIVEGLADRWGTLPHEPGKAVTATWFEPTTT